jgi:hypothetical protein
MIGLRRNGQPVFILMTLLALLISIPHQSAVAALIETDAAMDSAAAMDARDRIRQFLAREDVRAALVAQGIDPAEATARVETLTDAEIYQIADRIDELPAGGVLGFVILVLVIVLLVVLIMRVAK